MRRFLLVGNVAAILVVLAFGVERYVAPRVAQAIYAEQYKALMFRCDHVMREHFVAKQMVLASATEETIRNLDAAEIGLTDCHEYDKMRKKLMGWGLFIPSFYYQMTPKIPLNTRCSTSISKNLSINGRTRSSDQLGIWSYNINP